MYAFVVIAVLNGAPHTFIMERGLTAAACQEMLGRPDSGLSIDGTLVAGEGRCILESDLPEDDAPPEPTNTSNGR
jgi:hypothetical protein